MDGPSSTPPDAIRPSASETRALLPTLEVAPNPRQQRKIMGTLLTNAPGSLSAPDIPISNSEHAIFLERVRNGAIGRPQVDSMLSRVNTPFGNNPELLLEQARRTLGELSPNNQGRAIIAQITGRGMDARDALTPQDVLDFFQANPLPSDFEQTVGADFLSKLEAVNGPDKTAEYRESMARMMRTLYGKRMEYWEQYKLLEKDAGSAQKPKAPASKYIPGVPNQGNDLDDPTLMGPWKRG